MVNDKCPFTGALIGRQFGCQCSEEVTRREGPSIACNNTDMQAQCTQLFSQMKSAAITKLGYEDDLTQIPHAVLMKIQMGGLCGLQNIVNKKESGAESKALSVGDIQALVSGANQTFGSIENIPLNDLVEDIIHYKLKRRR
jgi:hypothetical protein